MAMPALYASLFLLHFIPGSLQYDSPRLCESEGGGEARYEIIPIPNRKQIQNAPLHVAVNKRWDIETYLT